VNVHGEPLDDPVIKAPMANLDSRVSTLVDQHIAHHASSNQGGQNTDVEDDTDALFAALEEEDDSAFRAARAQQLSEELKKYKPQGAPSLEVTGRLEPVRTLRSDDEVLRFTTENEKAVVHFLHAEFSRCGVMDRHLEVVASAQGRFDDRDEEKARFGRVDVKDTGFVVEKLGVRVLPCVVGFKEGVAVGRVVGFEGLVWGGREDGKEVTRSLEAKLVEWGLLRRVVVGRGEADGESDSDLENQKQHGRRGIRARKQKVEEDDDDDWD
jgi:hypothetical protein